jgi:putative transposase
MARKPRIEFPNALYHVIARGNRRNRIFLESRDYQKYLDLIARYKKRDIFKFYAYALMTNHLHLLIETGFVPLSKTMQCLQQTYTQYFNWRHGEVGHLFQGRYKAVLCERDSYLLELVRYIHCNPIRAGIVRKLSDHTWTSHYYYVKKRKTQLVDTGYVLAHFAEDDGTARLRYREFIADRTDERLEASVERPVDPRILGKDDFVQKVLQDESLSRSQRQKSAKKPKPGELLAIVSQHCGIVPSAIRGNVKSREIVAARRLLIYVARVYFGYSLKETAQLLEVDTTTVTKSIRIVSKQLKQRQGISESTMSRILKSTGVECPEFQA